MLKLSKVLFNLHQALCLILMLSLLLPLSALAEVRATQIKAALIVNISNYITWPELKTDVFTIACYGGSEEYKVLKTIEGRNRRGLPIKVISTQDVKQLKQAQLVFITKEYSAQVAQLSTELRRTSTLVVSEAPSENHKHTMINLVPQGTRYEFLVNKPNITYEGLTIQPELLLIGGTEMDVAILYREMEESNRLIRANNAKVEAELKANRQELTTIRRQLAKREAKLRAIEQEYEKTQLQVQSAKKNLELQTGQVENTETELERMGRQLAEKERAVLAQQDTVNKLTNEINEQLALFNQLEMDILQQNQKLSRQSNRLEAQSQKIETQNTLMLIGVLIVSIVLLAASVIYRFFLQNKRTNRELSHTLNMLQETQGKLVESEKMASLGNLVTGMAHELNTPIGTSICCISSLGESMREVDDSIAKNTLTKAKMMDFLALVQESENLLTSSLQRCADLIHNFKQVSADQAVAEPREIQLLDYLREIFGTLSVQLKRNRVEYELSGDNPTMMVDPGLLVQIISNLAMNAMTHAFEGVRERKLTVQVRVSTQQVEIHFADNGIGLSEEVKRKIFDPFFTTKRGVGGTGLGMNIVYNLVTAQLKGDIEVYSEEGQGTEFLVRMPLQQSPVDDSSIEETSSADSLLAKL